MRARYEGDAARAYRDRLSVAKDGNGATGAGGPPVPREARDPAVRTTSRPRRAVAPVEEERPPTLREARGLVVRTALSLARRSGAARRAALAYAAAGIASAWRARARAARRAAAPSTAAASSSLPAVNPAAARAAAGPRLPAWWLNLDGTRRGRGWGAAFFPRQGARRRVAPRQRNSDKDDGGERRKIERDNGHGGG